MQRITTKVQIIFGFVTILLGLVVISFMATRSLEIASTDFKEFSRVSMLAIDAEKFAHAFNESGSFIYEYLYTQDDTSMARANRTIDAALSVLREARDLTRSQEALSYINTAEDAAVRFKSYQSEIQKAFIAINNEYQNVINHNYQIFLDETAVLISVAVNANNNPLGKLSNELWRAAGTYYSAITKSIFRDNDQDVIDIRSGITNIEKILSAIENIVADQAGVKALKSTVQAFNKIKTATNNIITLIENRNKSIENMANAEDTALDAMPKMSEIMFKSQSRLDKEIATATTDTTIFLRIISIIVLMIGICIAAFILWRLAKTLKKLADFANALALGDFAYKNTIHESGEIGTVVTALEKIPTILNNMKDGYIDLGEKISTGHALARADAGNFQGAFVDIINSTNQLMQEYCNILEAIPSAIITMDKDMRVIYLNAASRSIAGENYYGKPCAELFRYETAGTDRDGILTALRTKRTTNEETRNSPVGTSEKFDISYITIPTLNEKNEVTCLLCLVTDLTTIKRQQNIIIQVAEEALEIANNVADTAGHISDQIEQVNNGAIVQRERVEVTASAMLEMNTTVSEVAHSAADAANQSDSTRAKAEEGAKMVKDVISSMDIVNTTSERLLKNMEELGKQAESIGGVMNVISDIADQTNLLALNAAIEAARAGDAGRGFAVVADEVRKLAEKTMEATQEVGTNISAVQNSARINIEEVNKSAANIEDASKLAHTSGEALAEILSLAAATYDVVASIATASEEQSATSDEINSSIDEVNNIVAQTSKDMEEATLAVRNLSDMAERLRMTMDKLKI